VKRGGPCLQQLIDFQSQNVECSRLQERVMPWLLADAHQQATTLHGILSRPSSELGEHYPRVSAEQLKLAANEVFTTFCDEYPTWTPAVAQNSLEAEERKVVISNTSPDGRSDEGSNMEHQRKISPWEELDEGLVRLAGRRTEVVSTKTTSTGSAVDVDTELALAGIEGLMTASESISLRKRRMQMSKEKQGLVVVASLLDKTPNLGGLARTCEIFQASRLVVNDMNVRNDTMFKQLAVTADRWIDMEQVRCMLVRDVSTTCLLFDTKQRCL
jgi:tRNA guanosine-2'-O-methyltransferase